jgi:hypothetical protein
MVGQQRRIDSYFQRTRSSHSGKEKYHHQLDRRVNYLKMNQGYDEEEGPDDDSNFVCAFCDL